MVSGIVFAGFYFNGKYIALILNDKVKFALLFAVKIIKLKTMRVQLLCYSVFIDCTKINVSLIV